MRVRSDKTAPSKQFNQSVKSVIHWSECWFQSGKRLIAGLAGILSLGLATKPGKTFRKPASAGTQSRSGLKSVSYQWSELSVRTDVWSNCRMELMSWLAGISSRHSLISCHHLTTVTVRVKWNNSHFYSLFTVPGQLDYPSWSDIAYTVQAYRVSTTDTPPRTCAHPDWTIYITVIATTDYIAFTELLEHCVVCVIFGQAV